MLKGSRATRRCKCSSKPSATRTGPKCSPFCQRPLTHYLLPWQVGQQSAMRPRPVWRGHLHNRGYHQAVRGAQGKRRDLTRVRRRPECLRFCQRPLTRKRTPPPCTCVRKRTRSLSEHIPCLALHIFPSLFPHPRDAALHRAPRGPRSRPPVGRVGRACSRAHLSRLRPLRHSLRDNELNDEAKQAVKDAAGSGVSITF